jgi:4-amino-4-deoxy-L-arabinose transferase-like glycosyltransferase
MAGWAFLFGWSEWSMHGLMAIFSLFAMLAFYKICKAIIPQYALFGTSALALSAAFVTGQNTMVDIPLLSIQLGFYAIALKSTKKSHSDYLLLGILCAAALLMKYTSLILLPALVLLVFLERDWKKIFYLLIPFGALALWSLWNFLEFGHIHILSRNPSIKSWFTPIRFTFWWIGILGAISPFAMYVFYQTLSTAKNSNHSKKVWLWRFFFFGSLISYGLVVISLFVPLPDTTTNLIFNFSFLVTGFGLLGIIVSHAKRLLKSKISKQQVMLYYWLISSFLFIILLTPFMAMRHVLLALPAVILLSIQAMMLHSTFQSRYSQYVKTFAIVVSIGITSLLASADYWFAQIARQQASEIVKQLPSEAKIWYTGHWGWVWYATAAGMNTWDQRKSQVHVGDYFVLNKHATKPCCLELTLLKTIPVEYTSWYQHYATTGLYASDMRPWQYSVNPINTYWIYQVSGIRP